MLNGKSIAMVVAHDNALAIGKDGDLPWRLPSDLAHFKRVTMGHPIVMGRRTWESIGRALPGRQNIVVTRQKDFVATGASVAHSLADAVDLAVGKGSDQPNETADSQSKPETVMIIGGGHLYEEALPFADRLEITEVDLTVDGDTFFPAYRDAGFVEAARTHAMDGDVSLAFVSLVRQSS